MNFIWVNINDKRRPVDSNKSKTRGGEGGGLRCR